jgi:hypothetical protein
MTISHTYITATLGFRVIDGEEVDEVLDRCEHAFILVGFGKTDDGEEYALFSEKDDDVPLSNVESYAIRREIVQAWWSNRESNASRK